MFETLLSSAEHRARIEAQHAALRFVNGVAWLSRDPAKLVGRTAYDEVLHDGKLVVRHYRPASTDPETRYTVPVLLVPPLMVKPFVFDLYPDRSLVAFLLGRGFDVYLVDFGEPDQADALVTLDDYVLRWMPAACEAVKSDSGAPSLSLLGYCMGAIFSLAHVAANRDRSVRNIVDIAAPVDLDKLGAMAWVMKVASLEGEALVRRVGNVPGGVSSVAFRLLNPAKNLTRYVDLFMNLWDEKYVDGFDAMNEWIVQFIDYPQQAFLQFSRDFVRHNEFAKGHMRFGDRVAELSEVEASLIAFAGSTDQVAPPPTVRAVLDMVGSRDKQFHVCPGGHMGLFGGRTAPENVWRPAADWLAERSGERTSSTDGARAGASPRERAR